MKVAAFLDVTSFFLFWQLSILVAGSFKLWGGVERCHTVLPPFLYRHALPVVVVLLRLLRRLGATHLHFAFWTLAVDHRLSYISIPNTHLHLIRVCSVGLHLLLLWYVCS